MKRFKTAQECGDYASNLRSDPLYRYIPAQLWDGREYVLMKYIKLFEDGAIQLRFVGFVE